MNIYFMNISVIYSDSLNHNCSISNYSYMCIHIHIPTTSICFHTAHTVNNDS